MNEKLLDNIRIARILYKHSWQKEEIIMNLMKLFDKPLSNGVTIRELEFKKGHLRICGLDVKSVNIVDNHCIIEVHWYQKPIISRQFDPFCSIFALHYNSIKKIYREVERVLRNLSD